MTYIAIGFILGSLFERAVRNLHEVYEWMQAAKEIGEQVTRSLVRATRQYIPR